MLQFVFAHRQPQQWRRSPVASHQVQSERCLIVGIEIGPVHRNDDRLALADDVAGPWREEVTDHNALVAQQPVDLFDGVPVGQPSGL